MTLLGGYFQEDEQQVVLAVHGPIVGPQASFPGTGAVSFSDLVEITGHSRMLPTATHSNDPSGPLSTF